MGMFGYMTDTETVEPLDTLDVESEGANPGSLFVHKSTFEIYVSGMPPSVHWTNVYIYISLLKGDDMESLLFHFLDDWLYKFSADVFFVPRVSMLSVS